MEQFKNYFKNREEVEAFFNKDTFKFCYVEYGKVVFTSIMPNNIENEFYFFDLIFKYNEEAVFNEYSNFYDGLDTLFLNEVICVNEKRTKTITMYKQDYIDPSLN